MSDKHHTTRTDDGGESAARRAVGRWHTPARSRRNDLDAAAYEGAVSLAAALGGTLLGVTPDRRRPSRT